PGVLNVITGSSSSAISAPIIGDPRLRKLSFTGSTEVGRKLIAQSADNVLKVSMELGGNAPFLIFDDADLDAAVEGAMLAKMRNIGEACTSANRFHVAERVASEFAERLAERMGAMKLGRGLLRDSAEQVLRTSMELGGNAPFLVFEDADLDAAVEGAMLAKLRNMGEACTAANRFLVHESVAAEFADRLAERMAALPVRRGTADDAKVGPLIDEKSRRKVQELVDDAVAKGAEVRTGGKPLDGPGWFYPPTVLTGVGKDARILTEEVFGPVAPVSTFTDEQQAVSMANDTEFGLVAYAYTRDVARSLRLTEVLESGMLGLNVGVVSNPAAPFGGVKQSGLGREGGSEGIEEYLETRYVGLADPFA
ncbi:MAG: aldehyde dehydrogenase family protein, partial [Nocardioidaceae bacterium]